MAKPCLYPSPQMPCGLTPHRGFWRILSEAFFVFPADVRFSGFPSGSATLGIWLSLCGFQGSGLDISHHVTTCLWLCRQKRLYCALFSSHLCAKYSWHFPWKKFQPKKHLKMSSLEMWFSWYFAKVFSALWSSVRVLNVCQVCVKVQNRPWTQRRTGVRSTRKQH